MIRTFSIVLAALLTVGTFNPAYALPVTYKYTGVISQLTDSEGLLDSSVFLGAGTTGDVIFDPALGVDLSSNPDFGEFRFAVPSASFSANIGNYRFLTPTGAEVLLSPFDNGSVTQLLATADNITATSTVDPGFLTSSGVIGGILEFSPVGTYGDPNSVLDLPNDLLAGGSGAWLVTGLVVNPDDVQETLGAFSLIMEITSFSKAVPEPSALALFGVGLIGLGAMTRRRRKVT